MRGRVSGTLLHYVVLLIVISGQEVETIAHHVGGIERGGDTQRAQGWLRSCLLIALRTPIRHRPSQWAASCPERVDNLILLQTVNTKDNKNTKEMAVGHSMRVASASYGLSSILLSAQCSELNPF